MHRIIAKHDMENPASGKVMLKCKMTYEGKLREYYYAMMEHIRNENPNI